MTDGDAEVSHGRTGGTVGQSREIFERGWDMCVPRGFRGAPHVCIRNHRGLKVSDVRLLWAKVERTVEVSMNIPWEFSISGFGGWTDE